MLTVSLFQVCTSTARVASERVSVPAVHDQVATSAADASIVMSVPVQLQTLCNRSEVCMLPLQSAAEAAVLRRARMHDAAYTTCVPGNIGN